MNFIQENKLLKNSEILGKLYKNNKRSTVIIKSLYTEVLPLFKVTKRLNLIRFFPSVSSSSVFKYLGV